MKKVGILFGQERTFPAAFVEHARAVAPSDIEIEFLRMGAVEQSKLSGYEVIIDRISQDVPFYRAALKHAAVMGTAVINNPFWWSAEDKLTANAMAQQVGVPVPKTVLLPSKDHPDDTTSDSFTNLEYPLPWDDYFEHIGFPAFMKPNTGGGWKSVYKVHNPQELWDAYGETGQLNMLLQEAIEFDTYFRCYCIGGKHVHLMRYEPRNQFHERYVRDAPPIEAQLRKTLEDCVLRLCRVLGYDFNTVELAVRDGVPYAIDFTNPAPDADVNSVGQANFEWVVKHAVDYAIERAQQHQEGGDNLTWGHFVQRSAAATRVDSAFAKTSPKPAAKSKAKAVSQPKADTKAKPAAKAKASTRPKPPAKSGDPSVASVSKKAVARKPAKGAVAKPKADAPAKVKSPAKGTRGAAGSKAKSKASTTAASLAPEAAKANQNELLARLGEAASDVVDDLKQISGIGPKLEGILHDIGVKSYAQLAKMKAKDYDLVDSLLTSFKGRGKRDDWSKQAKKFLKG